MFRPEQLAEITVEVVQEKARVRGGSGFFVAPGHVLTCAHVVGRGSGADEVQSRVRIRWNGAEYPATVIASAPNRPGGDVWPHPDLALVRLDDPPAGHDCAPLADREPAAGAALHAVGFQTIYSSPAALAPVALEYVGPLEGFHRVKGDEIPRGTSGGPVLDLATGRVCGVAKTSRNDRRVLGGLVVPVHAFTRLFPGLPDDPSWRALPSHIHRSFPLAALLRAEEEDELRALCRILPDPADAEGLYRAAVGDLGPRPHGRLRDLADLVGAVSDTVSRQDGMPALLALLGLLADSAPPHPARRLESLASTVAARIGKAETWTKWRRKEPPPDDRPSLEVWLSPSTGGPRRYRVAVWLCHSDGRTPVMKHAGDVPRTLSQIRSGLGDLLGPHLDEQTAAPHDITIAFVLPRPLLSEPVESWHLGHAYAPLGTQYPVVVRSQDRPKGVRPLWRERWSRLQQQNATGAVELGWIDCREERPNVKSTYQWFLNRKDRVVLALASDMSATRRNAVDAAFNAGVPVVIWRRAACTDHSADTCPGHRFRSAVEPLLTGENLRALPRLVLSLRIEADLAPGEHCGRSIAFLVDDPDRLPMTSVHDLRSPDQEA
ncbi:trypsin-like peptidase domain-containing protein [Actinocorallia longicatena]|uniref:Trypsin-like peptidase n=1 Tax=Actinocorallia longicatena TaxID=111803 RepID=A0ABP6QEC7_9ACTN